VPVERLLILVAFIGIVALVVLAGVRLGMLLAPRIERLSGSDEEDERGDDD
jgi:hypothetical protein